MYRLSAPSKTFLLGEYVVLSGGPGMVLNTGPRFELMAQPEPGGCPWHPESPAGQYCQANQAVLSGFQLRFSDPHQGRGGFGASAAAFLLCWALVQQLQGGAQTDEQQLLADYRASDASGGSGMDVVSQYLGGLAFGQHDVGQYHSLEWPFSELAFVLMRTGENLATHKHLRSVFSADLPLTAMTQVVRTASESIARGWPDGFVRAVQEYAALLTQAELVATHTQALLQGVSSVPGVMAAKGCGAMGADVVLVCVDAKQCATVLQWAQQQHLEVVCYGQQLSSGLQVSTADNFSAACV